MPQKTVPTQGIDLYMNKSGSYPILDTINSPADVRKLHKDQLKPLAQELREYLTHTVSISGATFRRAWARSN